MADSPLRILSLCSGVGGLDLGVRIAASNAVTVGYAEIEAYAASVLAARIADGWMDAAPIWLGDLRELDPTPWRGLVDCIIGGYPCQPFSHAGQRRGNDDERSLWGGIAELIADLQPRRCFFENVSGHLSLGFDQVGADLQSMGYRVAAGIFSAAEVGASHRRERLFIMADREGGDGRPQLEAGRERVGRPGPTGSGGDMAHAAGVLGQAIEWGQPDGTGGGVEHTQGNRRREGRPEPEFRRGRDAAAEHGGELADSESPRKTAAQQPGQPRGAERESASLANAGGEGPQERPRARQDGESLPGPCAATVEGGDLPIFAPGPADPRWRDILADAPHLEPAVCRVDAGVAPELDPRRPALEFRVPTPAEYVASALRWRIDRLRACGNGVVPLAAAYAWRTLAARLRAERESAEREPAMTAHQPEPVA